MKDFHQLFIDELKNIYSAENQLLGASGLLMERVKDEKLQEALEQYRKQGQEQLKRLDEVGVELKADLHTGDCQAITGMIQDCKKMQQKKYSPDVYAAALISQIQRMKHYEIACYGVLKAFAKHLQLKRIYDLLKESAKEEAHADHKLTEIAEGTMFATGINPKASRKSA